MKIFTKLLTLLFILIISQNQILPQKKNFKIEDVVFGSYKELTSGKLLQTKWLPNNFEFSYIEINQDDFDLVKEHVKNKIKRTIFSLSALNKKFAESNLDFGKSFPIYEWISDNVLRLRKGTSFYFIDTKNIEIIKTVNLPKDAENIEVSPDNKLYAYTKANNLFFHNEEKEFQITNENNLGIINGQAVHRNEFGITKGIFWAPNSKAIAFYKMDESMVTDYPLVNIGKRPATVELIKYPMAGMTSHEVKIGIYNLESEKTIWLETGEPNDQYLTSLTWEPTSENFYVGILNRDQNHLIMRKYDSINGKELQILFEEKDKEFVEPEDKIRFIPNSTDFIWLSERDGFNHLYRYTKKGELIGQITKGNFPIIEFIGFDEKGENGFFISNIDGIINRYLYKVNLASKDISQLTKQDGTNSIELNGDKSYFINKFSSLEKPFTYSLNDSNGNEIRIIKEFETPLNDYALGKTEIKVLKSSDGFDLYSRIIYPINFDEGKKYPVILYVYGGPHSQGVTNEFVYGRYDFWFHYMAQKGYIVFEIDNRGTSNRGIEFEQKTFRNLGRVEVEDQLTGLNYLKSLSYVDTTRFGVYGWSYGGFMATSLMLRTNLFKVGVAGGAVIDWSYYEIMYGERYMDTPQSNPEGYKESSLLNYVENLNGKLLLVHGTLDPVVVWQNSLLLAEKATKLNKQLDYYPYPGYGHHVSGKDFLGLYTKIANYFLENL